ncbi:DDE-type integrase/transposase/recombinase [Streptomyces sp. NBC_00448]|uniref:DDE-type integrase/transposase/recombinase n=1 Tax=Streptomyces sp. NBC_00448 TaxID=2903652 RepID=UPI002E1DE208
MVYVAFVVDTFSRRIVGWSAATTKHTELVLAAVEMGLWQRDREGNRHQPGQLVHHSDAGSQGGFDWSSRPSFALAEHLHREGIAASIRCVGDAYDDALMESTIGLYKPGRRRWSRWCAANTKIPTDSSLCSRD